ncbi:MAG: class II aldolase/adducin family protein [Solirubrobacterales bacterium]
MNDLRLAGLDQGALEEVPAYGRRLVEDGLVLGTSGNISIRVEGGYVITPSTIAYDEITLEDLVLLDDGGTQVDGRGRPSSETPMHLAVYATTDAMAVVHTHSPVAVALSTVVDEVPAVHYDIARLGGNTVPVVGYERFGSDALAQRAADAFAERSAVILRNHGTIACAPDLRQAYYRAQLVEWLAGVYWKAATIGKPAVLSDTELDEVVTESKRRRYGAVQP